jgi:hypothetical protein
VGFSLHQTSIEGGVSVRFQSLVTMELAVTDAMWHGHADIDKLIGLVLTEFKIDQNNRLGRRVQTESAPSSWKQL